MSGILSTHTFFDRLEMAIFPHPYGNAHEEHPLAYVAPMRRTRGVSISFSGNRLGRFDLHHSLTKFSGDTSRWMAAPIDTTAMTGRMKQDDRPC